MNELLKDKLFKKLDEKENRIIEIRRYLHEHPELSFKEEKTSKFINDFYKYKDAKVTKDIGGSYGVAVEIKGFKTGRTIALRADFDALPIKEETDLHFKSKNDGIMHACGHDAHTAFLLILGESLIELKSELPGKIIIIHQHAEEVPPGGARDFIDSGILDDIDEIYGIHVLPFAGPEVIAYREGPTMAGRSNFDIKIKGRGGHAAKPSTANDALVAGAYFVTTIQTVVSRRMDPFKSVVVTIGAFEAPGGYNVIQDKITLKGTSRYMNENIKEDIYYEIKRITNGLETMFGVEVELDYKFDYPVLVNSSLQTHALRDILKESEGTYFKHLVESDQIAASEDFACYLQNYPGSFFFVGCKPEGVEKPYENHHPKFDINENSLIVCAKALGEVVLKRLEI